MVNGNPDWNTVSVKNLRILLSMVNLWSALCLSSACHHFSVSSHQVLFFFVSELVADMKPPALSPPYHHKKKKSLLDSKMFCLFHFVQIYLECINYTRTKKYSPCLCSLCLTKHVQLDLASAICLCEIRSQCPRFSFVLPITCCFFLCSILADFPQASHSSGDFFLLRLFVKTNESMGLACIFFKKLFSKLDAVILAQKC